MADRDFVERVWYSHDGLAMAARAVLTPLEGAFRGIVGVRDMLYDAGWLPSHGTRIPAVSVGNLTVGGTGKTPVAAWIARELVSRGARPALVLRGYGDDEPLVHRTLNPDVPVFTGADRAATIGAAAASGANVAVLDDGFQHRAVHREADLVLINADRWTNDVRLLPAGPWREPIESVRRATLIIVTRKAADDSLVEALHARLSRVAPAIPRVGMRLEMVELVRADSLDDVRPLSDLAGVNVHVILSIADPHGFIRQLERQGALVRASIFADHHTFSDEDIANAVARAKGADMIVCTLKDAVKLSSRWPRLAPLLWYVSQHVTVERGVGGIDRLLDDLVRARSLTSATPTAG